MSKTQDKKNIKSVSKKENDDEPKDRMQQYKEAFDKYKSRSGKIGLDELYKILKEFGNEMSKQDIKNIISDIDESENEQLDLDDFITFMNRTDQLFNNEEAVMRAFETFDKNKDGKISMDEFRYILSDLGKKLPDSTIRAIFRESSIDKDNELNIEEFVNFWKSI